MSLLELRRSLPWRACGAALASACLLAAAAAGAEAWVPSEAQKAIVEDPARGLVGAVYLEKLARSEGQMFRVTVRAKILSRSGFDIATVENIASNAQSIEGRTISPSGRTTELSSKDIRKVTVLKAGGYSIDQKAFTLPALEPGCFIEYTYKEWGWLGAAEDLHTEMLFQDKYPILRQELRTPKRFPFSSSVRMQKGVRIDFRADGNEYVYETFNAGALHDEPYGLPANERAAAVIFAWVFSDIRSDSAETFWKAATREGFVPLLKQYLAKPSRVAGRLKTIPGSRAEDPKARLAAIYHHVQTTLKNRWALKPGEMEPKGGWKRNESAADTLSHGDGTPWDLASVCASLLRADGWRYRAVFTPDREERFFHPEIPSLFQFDGWVIEVADPALPDPVYLAFDHPLLSFGRLPWNRLGVAAYAVDLDAETGERIEIPQFPPEANARRRAWKISVSEEGAAAIDRATRLYGEPAFRVRANYYRMGKDAFERELRDELQKTDPPGELESVVLENAGDPEAELVQTTLFRRRAIAASLPGGRMELTPLSMLQEANPFTQEKRDEPVYFPYPYVNVDALTIAPPPGYAVDALPAPVDTRNTVGRYAVSASQAEDGSVLITRVFQLTRFSGSPEFYPQYRRLFEGASRGDTGFSIVFKRTAKGKSGG